MWLDAKPLMDIIVADYIKETTEVDAYAFSTIASYCTEGLGNLVEEDITDEPLKALNKAFVYFSNKEVPIKDQIVFASPDFVNALRETSEVTKFLAQQDYDRKDVNFQILKYQGRTIVEVSPERLRTNILLFGQEGYAWASDSKAINFLMVAKEAVIHVVKFNQVKVIGGDMNLAGQGFDGYTIFARVYHDVFVPDNKRVALYCSVAQTAKPAPAMALEVLVADGKIKSIVTVPGDKLAFVYEGTGTVGGTFDTAGKNPVRVGDKTTASSWVAINSDKKVLATYSAE